MFLILFLHGPFTPKELDMQSVHYFKLLQDVIVFQCFWYYSFIGHLHPNKLICKVCIIVFFIKKLIFQCIISSSCKKITLVSIIRCGDDMYVMRYADLVTICIYHVNKTCYIVFQFDILLYRTCWLNKDKLSCSLSISSGLRTTLNNWPYMGCYVKQPHALNSEHAMGLL